MLLSCPKALDIMPTIFIKVENLVAVKSLLVPEIPPSFYKPENLKYVHHV